MFIVGIIVLFPAIKTRARFVKEGQDEQDKHKGRVTQLCQARITHPWKEGRTLDE